MVVMTRKRSNVILESYKVRIPDSYHDFVFKMLKLEQHFVNAILDIKWREFKQKGKIEISNENKAYVILDGYKVDNLFDHFYLPNRFARIIWEDVGRILRSIDERQQIYDCLTKGWYVGNEFVNFDLIGATADDEVYEAFDVVKELQEKYNPILINQEIKHLINIVRRRFTKFKDKDIRNFFEVTKPEKKALSIDFAADGDGQVCKVTWTGTHLKFKLKVPTIDIPINPSDWTWIEFEVKSTKRLLERLRQGCRLRRPRLIAKRVTNGRLVSMFEIIVEVPVTKLISDEILKILKKKAGKMRKSIRVLAVDLGLRKFATCIPFEITIDGKVIQLSRPIFIRENNNILRKLARLLDEISRIQRKLSKVKKKSLKWRILYKEFYRKWRKIRNIVYQLKHYVSTFIVKLALLYDCEVVVVGKLDTYKPPVGFSKLSALLNMAFPRSVREYLEYKCRRVGIAFVRVSEKGTSRTCPRCGSEGKLIKSYNVFKECKNGRVFYCPRCEYRADRDYVGALNIFKKFILEYLSFLTSKFHLLYNSGSIAPGVSPGVCVSSGISPLILNQYLTILTVTIYPLNVLLQIMIKTSKNNKSYPQ